MKKTILITLIVANAATMNTDCMIPQNPRSRATFGDIAHSSLERTTLQNIKKIEQSRSLPAVEKAHRICTSYETLGRFFEEEDTARAQEYLSKALKYSQIAVSLRTAQEDTQLEKEINRVMSSQNPRDIRIQELIPLLTKRRDLHDPASVIWKQLNHALEGYHIEARKIELSQAIDRNFYRGDYHRVAALARQLIPLHHPDSYDCARYRNILSDAQAALEQQQQEKEQLKQEEKQTKQLSHLMQAVQTSFDAQEYKGTMKVCDKILPQLTDEIELSYWHSMRTTAHKEQLKKEAREYQDANDLEALATVCHEILVLEEATSDEYQIWNTCLQATEKTLHDNALCAVFDNQLAQATLASYGSEFSKYVTFADIIKQKRNIFAADTQEYRDLNNRYKSLLQKQMTCAPSKKDKERVTQEYLKTL